MFRVISQDTLLCPILEERNNMFTDVPDTDYYRERVYNDITFRFKRDPLTNMWVIVSRNGSIYDGMYTKFDEASRVAHRTAFTSYKKRDIKTDKMSDKIEETEVCLDKSE